MVFSSQAFSWFVPCEIVQEGLPETLWQPSLSWAMVNEAAGPSGAEGIPAIPGKQAGRLSRHGPQAPAE